MVEVMRDDLPAVAAGAAGSTVTAVVAGVDENLKSAILIGSYVGGTRLTIELLDILLKFVLW